MKKFLKKFNNTKLSIRLVYIFVSIIFIFSYGYLFRSLLLLNNIETTLRVIALSVLGVLLLLYIIGNLLLLMSKKNKTVIFLSFIVLLIAAVSLVGSLTINKVYGILDSMSKDKILYTTNMILLNDKEFSNTNDFKVGILNNETDVEGNILPKEYIKKEKLKK